MPSLYIFIDESGNFDFSRTGTNYFVLSAVTALDPLVSSQILQKLEYKLLSDGINVECFHASPDLQKVRNYVLKEIERLTNIRINYVYAEKRKTHPKYQSPEAIYALFGKTLLKYVFKDWLVNQYDQIIVIFDKALTRKQQNSFLRVVKPELKETNKPYKIYFHQTMADFNGQIADYSAWSRYVSLERKELRPIEKLKRLQTSDFNIFSRGKKNYY